MQENNKNILGIDIGSISISIAEINDEKQIVQTAYAFHEGEIDKKLGDLLLNFNLESIGYVATTSTTPPMLKKTAAYDSRVSYISAAKHFNSNVRSILIVGGEKFGLVNFDNNGEYLNYKSNTSCAAGTGGFLDQQSKRLNLSGIEEFCEISAKNTGEIPKIASRCAVFAKTDLIHASQEGHSLMEICDGLCFGLARNIVDTLFGKGSPTSSIIFCGGVSKNKAVAKHISSVLGTELVVNEHSHLFGAIGAALNHLEERDKTKVLEIKNPDELILEKERVKNCYYEPLSLTLSTYPDFTCFKKYEFTSKYFPSATPLEVDIYQDLGLWKKKDVFLGIDIGSTSTKALVLDEDKNVLAGFYTRTSGRPIEAVQTMFESIDDMCSNHSTHFKYIGVGTTGSGRKFVGEIIGADSILDEITAHARAAYELDPNVDTIIEIGGQDAKFTTMRKGMVTFSVMNNVCAAGTGSFIEEQATKMNCPLSEYSGRTENVRAPLSSDRCTVFMERDLNHYLNTGYSRDEVLASVLHSVRENYLAKVATEKNIGNKIFFQGATAKNKALVAAFEQRLKKPIMVSKYCHLTGALGVALDLRDQSMRKSRFRGINLFKKEIPVRSEVCMQCNNHCKIRTASVGGETVAFGFLCGKDYKDSGRGNKNRFDLLKERENAYKFVRSKKYRSDFTIGIPATLHIYEDLPFWEKFFDSLSIRTITSDNYKHALKDGKRSAGAEFCAPIAATYGHVKHLYKKADYIFFPDYQEVRQKKKEVRRNYCYYTQFAPVITSLMSEITDKTRILHPLVKYLHGTFAEKLQLYRTLRLVCKNINPIQISLAYDKASEHCKASQEKLQNLFRREVENAKDISVVLLGRPYTILSGTMNNSIPDIFAKHGVKPFSQDMLTIDENELKLTKQVLNALHWNYGSKTIEASEIVANMEGVYPVLVTSFKCTPDSYVIEYFKTIFDICNKPYLILQLDEHDSSIGYETRIEAGIRSFRNHLASQKNKPSKPPDVEIASAVLRQPHELEGKTLLIPNWDYPLGKLMEAVLQREGVDARIIDETKESIQMSLKLNTGQCLPLTAIVQNVINYIEKHKLKPEDTVVWSVDSTISCGIGMFPHYIKKLMESYGNGMEKVSIYAGRVTFFEFSVKTSISIYFAYLLAGYIKKIGCRFRPYEVTKGSTDKAIEESLRLFYNMFLSNILPQESTLKEVVKIFEGVKLDIKQKPKVAIFGDLYSRDNCVLNQDLVKTIEDNGGEVIAVSYSDYMKMVGESYIKKWLKEGKYVNAATAQIMYTLLPKLEKRYSKYFTPLLDEPEHDVQIDHKKILSEFGVKFYHTGESLENILKVHYLKQRHPDLSFFVQANPALCCPSLITEAMSKKLEEVTGIPIVTIEYDGTGGSKNDAIIPYLKFLREKSSRP